MLKTMSYELASRLRDTFQQLEYSTEGLEAIFGTASPPLDQNRNRSRFEYFLNEENAQNTLIRLFLMGETLPRDRAYDLLGQEWMGLAGEIGLTAEDGDLVAATLMIVPYKNMLVASDFPISSAVPKPDDYVIPLGPSAYSLFDMTIRRHNHLTLDLGTGCGVHAIAAARHSNRVLATDISPRSLEVTKFNAALNLMDNIETRQGSLFEPVFNDRFDLIVSNPPFVIVPSQNFTYRENSLELDGLAKTLVQTAPRNLREGGYFQMVFEWVQIDEQPWEERLASWFQSTGCDAWLVKTATEHPSWYAHYRLRELVQKSEADDARIYADCMSYYNEHKVTAVHGGMVTMRKREGKNWLRVETMPDGASGELGPSFLKGFAARDFIEENEDAKFPATRLKLSPSVEAVLHSQFREGSWATGKIDLNLRDAFPVSVEMDGSAVEFLGGFDGQRTTGEVLNALLGQIPEDQRARVKNEALRMVMSMVERGVLVSA
ncbi:MAG: methyltransferase [Candidatus Eisenbacteria bacterium]|uniref:Methyltransferase n=1 Tax=Eiseniibacteriota bacterium TaxID=2212470 RepID=A0A7Y2H2U7_UNCEI|nr:methyltransferase [Candidatus Eisenbacteria bacterium]